MKRIIYQLVLIVMLAVLGSGCSWLGIGGIDDERAPAALVAIEQPIAIKTLWEVQVGSGAGGAFIKLRPAVAEKKVYATSHDGVIMAIDAVSGKIEWESKTKLPISAGVGVGDGLVLVGTSQGEVLALNMETGEESWRIQVSSEILASPRVAEGVVVIRTVDGKFIGLDAFSGARLWVYEYTVPVLTLRGSSPPLLAQGAVIAGLDTGRLLVLSLRNGVPVWEKTITPPRGRTELDRMVDIDTELKVIGGILYVAAYQGSITAIDLRDGSILWNQALSSHAGLDADRRQVYVVDDQDVVWALDRRNGSTLWKQEALTRRGLSAPAVSDDYVVMGDFEGYLHWLAKDDGSLVGRIRADKKGITVAPVASGDTLYVLGNGGMLGAFRLGGDS